MSLSAIFSLARTLRDEEELGKVVEMSVSLLEKLERVSGNDGEYSNTINAMNNLAVALRDKGRIREAAAIQNAVLENLGRTLEDDQTDPLTIIAMNNLAVILRDQGKLDEASMMQRRVVVGQERIHGKDHHLTVVAMNNLAWTLKEEGKLEEAAAMQQEVLEKRRRILGNEHASTVLAMNNLAAMLADQGKINEATDMQQEVLEKRQRILGGEHHDTLAAMNNLATMLRDQGKVGEAATMQTEALEMQRRVLGDRHPTTIIALNNLALILTRLGSLEKAMKMLEEVLDVRQRILGDSHPDTIEAMINFARILQKQGKPDVAVVMFDEAFVKQQQVLGDNHPSTIMTISYGASAMLDQGILDDAVLVQTIALEKLTEILGEGHPKTITLLSNLASMIIRQEKLEEATIMFKTALEQMERIVEEGHPDVITIMGNLLYALQRQGKLDEAAVISQSLEERKHVHQMHESFSFDFALGGNIGNGLGSLTLHLIEAQQPRMSRFQPPRIGSRLVFRPADTQRPRESTSRPYGGESDKSMSEEHSASDRLAKDDLCEACRKITLEGLGCLAEIVPKLRWVEEYRAEYDLTKVHGYEYPHTVGDLDDLCRHCKLCNRIRKTIYHDNDPFTIASRDKTSRFKLSFFMQNGTGCLKIHLESATNSKLNAQKNAAPFLLRLFSDPEKEENFAHLALGRSIVPPDSETAFRRIQSSLEHCLVNHPMCSRTLSGTVVHQESTLPTRVIDVCLDNSSDIRIQETAGLYGKYVALSYCWGESSGFPELMLTKATIDQLKLNLPVESLP